MMRHPRPHRKPSSRLRTRRRRLLLLLLVLAGILFIIRTLPPPPEAGDKPGSSPPDNPGPVAAYAGPFQAEAEWWAGVRAVRAEVRKNETLIQILTRLGLGVRPAYQLARALAEVFDLTQVRPGAEVTVYKDKKSGEPLRLEYTRQQGQTLVAVKTQKGYAASWRKFEPIVSLEAVRGRIQSTLWGSAVEVHGLEPELVLAFTDIFAYDVDFFTDIREGDSFTLLYEKKYSRGEYLGAGRILAARFVNQDRDLKAFYFEGADGRGGYYDEKARSLKKMFLKSPLRYRRISSYFSHRRFHPILKIYRPHLGVDYAAPQGTPVETVGDGRVIFAGWKKGYGKFVVIKHNKAYTTTYGHLSGFARGLKRGRWVKQGDLIGYVGSTGMSTGPHLDYRLKKNGKFVNPLALKLEPAPPIKPAERPEFFAQVERWRAEMAQLLAAGAL